MRIAYDYRNDDEGIDFSRFDESSRYTTAPDPVRLIGAVADEVVTLSGPLAAVASVLNAISGQGRTTYDPEVVATVMPPEPVVYQAVLDKLVCADADGDLLSLVQHFHHRLALVTRATRPALQRGAREHGGSIDVVALADAWRQLVRDALELVGEADALGCLPGGCVSRIAILRATLEAAADGGTPCIREDGCVEIPGIIERRRHERLEVSWAGWLRTAGALLPITVVDVSRGGAGLSCEGQAHIGEEVVLLANGRQLAGCIAWTAPGRVGVQFDAALAPDDDVMIAARRQSATQ
jgi:hypothetical protein